MTKGDNASTEQRSMETGLMYAEIDINTANGLQMIALFRYEAEGSDDELGIADKPREGQRQMTGNYW